MDLFYYSRLAYARTIAENSGFTLVEEEGRDSPRTDGKTIFVPKYNVAWDYEGDEATLWWGKFLHEIYHNDARFDHRDIFKILKKNKKDLTTMLKYTYNIIEDHRIERDEWGEFPGRDVIMQSLRKKMYEEFKDGISTKGTGSAKMDAVYWLQWESFSNWLSLGYTNEYMKEETKEYFDKIKGLIPDIMELDSAEASWKISKHIVDILGDDSKTEENKEKDKGGEKKEGEENQDDDGEAEENGVDYGAFCEHDHAETTDKEEKTPKKVKACATGIEHVPAEMKEINPDELSSLDMASKHIHHKISMEGLAGQIKRYLLVRSKTNMVNNQKSGRIDTSTLWKASVYRNTSSGKKVFQQDSEHLNLDTVVSLLVDQSGSMGGARYYNAAAAAAVLGEVLAKIGVKTRITGFTDCPMNTYCVVHKNFNEKINRDHLVTRMSKASNWRMSGNADGENILWEYNKIASRPEKKKIIIVLSDGEPADSKSGDIYTFTQKVIKNIEKSPVKIIGIGIETDSVKYFYTTHKVLSSSNNIESTLLNILRDEVLHA